jgi:hypothetical protein
MNHNSYELEFIHIDSLISISYVKIKKDIKNKDVKNGKPDRPARKR